MEEYKKALSEINTIINNMPDELTIKIPPKFKKLVEEEKDDSYKSEVNDLVIKNNMMPETVVILGLMYRDFLCSKLEREELQLKDKEDLEKLKIEEQNQKFNYEDLFKKHMKSEKEEMQLIEVKKKWYEKVIEYFKIKIRTKE